MEGRIIIHLDMDAFFAAVEERENPQFRGKPLVVGAEPRGGRGRGVVSTANYEARKYGIHSAMPISQAYRLCPEAVFLPPNFALYKRTSEHIMKIIRVFSPLVEQVSLDEAYIDISKNFTIVKKTPAFDDLDGWKKAGRIAQKMREAVWKAEKLPCSCGVGPNKMMAKIACELGKPNGLKVVRTEGAEKLMEQLDVERVPGIGRKTAAILRESAIQTVADLKKLSEHDMEDLFGKRGRAMYGRVRGRDEEPVAPEREGKSIGKETTFEQDTRDPELLVRTFEQLAKQVAGELAEQDVFFKAVSVVCRFSGFETHSKSKTLSAPSQSEAVLRSEAMKLLLRFVAEQQKPIRLIGVRVQIARAGQI